MVVVVGAAQRPALIGHHVPAPAVVLSSCTRAVPRRHLCGQDAGRGARVGVGVAGVVH